LYQTRLVASPGTYQLLVFGRLLKREAVAFLQYPIDLEDFSGSALALSRLLLFEQVITRKEFAGLKDPVSNRFLGGSRPLLLKDFVLVPAPDNRFRRGQKLTVFFEVYNPALRSETAEPALEIDCRFWRGDQPVARIPAQQLEYITEQHEDTAVVRTTYGLSIPLQSFDPGEYSFEVEVHDLVLDTIVSNRTLFNVF
jgi:hypothetical protein